MNTEYDPTPNIADGQDAKEYEEYLQDKCSYNRHWEDIFAFGYCLRCKHKISPYDQRNKNTT